MIEFACFKSPIGDLSILAMKEGILKISFPNKSKRELDIWCWEHLEMEIVQGNYFINQAKNQILNYLSGKRKSLNFPIVHINSPFRKKVLETQRKIPYGKTCSYQEVARMVGNQKAFRAVGSANAQNPLPLYFPCHRIICSDGSLGGFGGGLITKKFLLSLEQK